MPFRLVLTEKPSVARDIAKALGVNGRHEGWLGGGDLRITWCLGHLLELVDPQSYRPEWKSWREDTLPMLPEDFKLTPRKDSNQQWRTVRDLLKDRDLGEVVNACDAGREGELIFGNAYRHAGCRAPVRRLWISAMTPAAIRTGFDRLRPGADLIPLESAARCRSEADWLVGLNATRAMTLMARRAGGGALLSLGRVQTPTLALLSDREDAIDAFVPETFWQIKATLQAEAGRWQALWTGPKTKDGSPPDRLAHKAAAEAIVARVVQAGAGAVGRVERKESREKPPLLYDLTALQKEANKRFHFSAKRTLDLAQALYERHKVLTYPRTDSRHLSSAQVPGLPGLVRSLDFGPYAPFAQDVQARWPVKLGKRIVDDAEVSDHHAIVPTGTDPRSGSLDVDEKRIFDLVARRFLGALHPEAVFANATINALVAKERFVARGRTCLEQGWRAVDPPSSKGKPEILLPPVNTGDAADVVKAALHEGTTRPPKRLTEATLLGAMEQAGEGLDDGELKRAMKRNGLGTPATRAAIIETLLRRGYVEREGRDLVPTPAGRTLISALPAPELRSPRLTGQWEARLVAMAEGKDQRDAFMGDIRAFTQDVVARILAARPDAVLAQRMAPPPPEGPPLGPCPRCEGTVKDGGRSWRCDGCAVEIPKSVAQRDVSERMAKALLADGTTKAVKGFKSRKGNLFVAALTLDEAGKVTFHFPEAEPLGACPTCGKPVRKRRTVYACDTGRECPFVIGTTIAGRTMEDHEIRQLLTEQRTPRLHGFHQRTGAIFKAALVLEPRGARFDYRKGPDEPPDAPPPGGPPFAFGLRVRCPLCLDAGEAHPGYVIAGRAAWGCSRWKAGCGLRLPFQPLGVALDPEQARRLLGKARETVLMKLPVDIGGATARGRLVIDASAPGGWRGVKHHKGGA